MKIDYIPLANVPTVESLTDSAKVLVIDSGEVKKTAVANVGGGGGGSSDFSTAEVTVVVEENTNEYVFYGAITEEAEGDYPADSLPFNNISESPYVFNVILYKGQAWGQIAINGVQVTPWEISATGDIETSGNGFDITGDGTITITAST